MKAKAPHGFVAWMRTVFNRFIDRLLTVPCSACRRPIGPDDELVLDGRRTLCSMCAAADQIVAEMTADRPVTPLELVR